MESGRKDVETKIEKVEGTRERMARGIQNRVLMKSLKKELIMIYRLKCQGFGVLMSTIYTETCRKVRRADGWIEKLIDT